MKERSPPLREPVLYRLFDVVVQQCTLPAATTLARSPGKDQVGAQKRALVVQDVV